MLLSLMACLCKTVTLYTLHHWRFSTATCVVRCVAIDTRVARLESISIGLLGCFLITNFSPATGGSTGERKEVSLYGPLERGLMQALPIEVFVSRDYSAGMEPTAFSRMLPRDLEGRGVSEHDFLKLVDTINDLFKEAETIGWTTVLESVFGCLSCYSLFLCYKSHYKRTMEQLDKFLRVQNATVFLPQGVRVKNPMYNGTLHLEFLVYPRMQRE